ncbi:MAG: tetratricopeptide repeat protein [bacterium]|nr:tetratricopeptide repeat protein [bacterium]
MKRSLGRSVRENTLQLCFASVLFAALACSEEPATTDLGDHATSRVNSAPPRMGEVTSREQARTIDRKHAAREAFDRWAPLVMSGAIEQARALCSTWLEGPDRGHHSEAHKCLANATIATSRATIRGLPEEAKGAVRSPVTRAGADAAIAHYDAAIATAPRDPDAHVGRVDILIVSGRYREANVALDESLGAFSSRALLDNWFNLLGRFQRSGAVDEALAFLKVIEKHHPLDHRVVSNLGAYYAMAGQVDEALSYSQRAVTIAPDDPINRWNLAKIYDRRGQLDDANRHYQAALAVFGDKDPRAHCDYVEFVATRLGDSARACDLAKLQCSELYERKCTGDGSRDDERDPVAQ